MEQSQSVDSLARTRQRLQLRPVTTTSGDSAGQPQDRTASEGPVPETQPETMSSTDAILVPARAPKPTHKFELPKLPLPPQSHLKHRYHPLVEQVTNLIMRDGKKSLAQRVSAKASDP